MATRNKYRELNLGPSEPITRRNSVQGMLVTADYLDPINNQRTLVLKRVGLADAEAPKPKPRQKRKAKPVVKTAEQEYNDMKAADEDYEAQVARG